MLFRFLAPFAPLGILNVVSTEKFYHSPQPHARSISLGGSDEPHATPNIVDRTRPMTGAFSASSSSLGGYRGIIPAVVAVPPPPPADLASSTPAGPIRRPMSLVEVSESMSVMTGLPSPPQGTILPYTCVNQPFKHHDFVVAIGELTMRCEAAWQLAIHANAATRAAASASAALAPVLAPALGPFSQTAATASDTPASTTAAAPRTVLPPVSPLAHTAPIELGGETYGTSSSNEVFELKAQPVHMPVQTQLVRASSSPLIDLRLRMPASSAAAAAGGSSVSCGETSRTIGSGSTRTHPSTHPIETLADEAPLSVMIVEDNLVRMPDTSTAGDIDST